MSLDKNLIDQFVNITSGAAIASYKHIGKKNKKLADKAATDNMRKNINNLNIKGEVVIGEGELDHAPMLYIGEKLGTGNGPELDIAVDPLEGTNFAANNFAHIGFANLSFVLKVCYLFSSNKKGYQVSGKQCNQQQADCGWNRLGKQYIIGMFVACTKSRQLKVRTLVKVWIQFFRFFTCYNIIIPKSIVKMRIRFDVDFTFFC